MFKKIEFMIIAFMPSSLKIIILNRSLHMGENSRIGGRLNWFTASHLHNRPDNGGFDEVTIGSGSNITSRHLFDAQQFIKIGSNTLIAGFRSTFWAHGYRSQIQEKDQSITIGDHCYIGSQAIFSPGTSIGNRIIVGTSSVISKNYSDINHILLAGTPCRNKKINTRGLGIFFKNA